MIFRSITTGLLTFMVSTAASAHGIYIFAAPEGDVVKGRVYYPGNDPVPGVMVNIMDLEGNPLEAVQTNDEGRFEYTPDEMKPLVFVVETNDGHYASHKLLLQGESPSLSGFVNDPPPELAQVDEEVRRLVEHSVGHEMGHLLERMDQLEHKIRLQDILGGIGYIAGVMGLIAFWKARSNRE